MSDEAQRMFIRILLWAICIVVVCALIGVVYYYVAIKPGMRPQATITTQTQPTVASAQQQAVAQTLESTTTVAPQTFETNQQTVEQSLQNSPPASQQSAQTNQQAVENALNGN